MAFNVIGVVFQYSLGMKDFAASRSSIRPKKLENIRTDEILMQLTLYSQSQNISFMYQFLSQHTMTAVFWLLMIKG